MEITIFVTISGLHNKCAVNYLCIFMHKDGSCDKKNKTLGWVFLCPDLIFKDIKLKRIILKVFLSLNRIL